MKEWAIEIENLSVAYDRVQALSAVTVGIPKGARVAVVGPNGAGKSTLFKSILGLERIQNGSITLLGVDQKEQRAFQTIVAKKVAYIPQATRVNEQFPATVFDIVLMGRYPHITNLLKIPSAQDRSIAQAAIERMQLTDLQTRQITELSGGQRQRVFIARALAQEAELYLMDEPLAGIDATTEQLIMATLKEFQNEGKTSIVIHHDIHTLAHYFDSIVWLNKTVVQAGAVSDILTNEWYRQTYQLAPIEGIRPLKQAQQRTCAQTNYVLSNERSSSYD